MKLPRFIFTAEEPLTHQVMLTDKSDKILLMRVKGALSLAKLRLCKELWCSRVQQGERHFACSMIGVVFMYKRRHLGDPNELGLSKSLCESRALVCRSGRCCFCKQQTRLLPGWSSDVTSVIWLEICHA